MIVETKSVIGISDEDTQNQPLLVFVYTFYHFLVFVCAQVLESESLDRYTECDQKRHQRVDQQWSTGLTRTHIWFPPSQNIKLYEFR